MLIFSILIHFLYLISCSQCLFFGHFFSNDLATKWFNYKVSFKKKNCHFSFTNILNPYYTPKKTFKKLYSNGQENNLRRTIFERNFNFVTKLNQDHAKGLISFKTELNSFADLTREEFLKQKTGLIVNYNQSEAIKPPKLHRKKRDINLPTFKDWRSTNKVSPVQDQGKCGGCYAFATVAAIESFQAIKNSYMPFYSVQELIGMI